MTGMPEKSKTCGSDGAASAAAVGGRTAAATASGGRWQELERGFLVEMVRSVLAQSRRDIVSGDLWKKATLQWKRWSCVSCGSVGRCLAPSLARSDQCLRRDPAHELGERRCPASILEEFQPNCDAIFQCLNTTIAAGARGKRDVHNSRLIEQLTGAEAAIVVNKLRRRRCWRHWRRWRAAAR